MFKRIICVVICAFSLTGFASAAGAEEIIKLCVSKSGRSTYTLTFDTAANTGNIRYQFMRQDIMYKVHIQKIDKKEISGIAMFESSRTGETKGNPFHFTYSKNQKCFFRAECGSALSLTENVRKHRVDSPLVISEN